MNSSPRSDPKQVQSIKTVKNGGQLFHHWDIVVRRWQRLTNIQLTELSWLFFSFLFCDLQPVTWALIYLIHLPVWLMKCRAIRREIKLIIFTVSLSGILIKNLKMLLFLRSSARWLSHRKKWVSNVSSGGLNHARTAKTQELQTCGELKMGLGEQWHIMYHLTRPNTALNKALDSRMIE